MARDFWKNVDECLDALEGASTATAVIETLNAHFEDKSAGDAFFGGSGGDRQLWDSLGRAGWKKTWSRAPYYYVAENPSGELLTYIEGDVYRGDCR